VRASSEIKNLAESPAFSVSEKLKVYSEVFEKIQLNSKLRDFLTLLIQNERFFLIEEIFTEFRDHSFHAQKIKQALLETAFELSDSEINQIQKVLEAALDSHVKLEVKIEPNLIAGLRVEVDGKTLDATLRANIDYLKQELLGAEA
jgi:F-type H+-transporting ATPase subunit delta